MGFERISEIIPPGVDAKAFETAMLDTPSVSLKLNRRKSSGFEETGYEGGEPVKWCESGFYLEERPKFTLNPLLHAGVFYVQDASSMIYETIVRRLISRHGLPSSPLALDLCAAPGGKTTSIINAVDDGALVVANEVVGKRSNILLENLSKWGFPGTVVTSSSTSAFTGLSDTFDLVAVDAPCSGEGMMRKDEEARSQWSPGLVRQCASLQREILADAVRTLKPGGYMIYSTCTFNRFENEQNLEWLVRSQDLEPVNMDFPEEWGIGSEIDSPYPALRFMPHLTRGEGLFAAVLKKPDAAAAVHTDRKKLLDRMRKRLNVKNYSSKRASSPEVSEIMPLRCDFDRSAFPSVELSLDDALRYLRRESLVLPPSVPKGHVVVSFKGHPLGFVKNIGSRANNLYPNEWRIRI